MDIYSEVISYTAMSSNFINTLYSKVSCIRKFRNFTVNPDRVWRPLIRLRKKKLCILSNPTDYLKPLLYILKHIDYISYHSAQNKDSGYSFLLAFYVVEQKTFTILHLKIVLFTVVEIAVYCIMCCLVNRFCKSLWETAVWRGFAESTRNSTRHSRNLTRARRD